MSDGTRSVAITVGAFVAGLVLGAGTGVVAAPQSGAKTRRQIRRSAEDVGERATRVAEDATMAVEEVVEDVLDRGRQMVG